MSSVGSIAVIDASVIMAIVLGEPHHDEARQALNDADEAVAPELLVYEIANAVSKKVRQGRMSEAEAHERRAAAHDIPVRHVDAASLDAAAFDLSLASGHSVYDCFYLALAIEKGCPLVTFDARLAAAAERIGFGGVVHLIGQ